MLALKTLDEFGYQSVLPEVTNKPRHSAASSFFSGIWKSEGGSSYIFDGSRFICIAVHHSKFCGWVGRCAVKDIRPAGSAYSGLQAFRCGSTGELHSWAPITISLVNDVVTKFFSDHIPSHRLVYGHVERYFRVPRIGDQAP